MLRYMELPITRLIKSSYLYSVSYKACQYAYTQRLKAQTTLTLQSVFNFYKWVIAVKLKGLQSQFHNFGENCVPGFRMF